MSLVFAHIHTMSRNTMHHKYHEKSSSEGMDQNGGGEGGSWLEIPASQESAVHQKVVLSPG